MFWFKFSKEIFWDIFDMFWFRFKRPREIFWDMFSKEIFWDIIDMFCFRLKRAIKIFWTQLTFFGLYWNILGHVRSKLTDLVVQQQQRWSWWWWPGQRPILQAAHITTAQAMLCIVEASYHSQAIACIWKFKMHLMHLPINVVYMCILKYKGWIVELVFSPSPNGLPSSWEASTEEARGVESKENSLRALFLHKLTRIRGHRMLRQLKCLFKSNLCYLPFLSMKLREENQSLSFWFSRWYLMTLFDSANRIWGHDNILAIWVAFLCKHVIRLLGIDCDFKMIGLLAYSWP